MPTTLAGILILAFAVLPGVPGDKIYRMLVGYDWREDQWHRALRLLGFSLFGLALYSLVAAGTGLSSPHYLSPKLLQEAVGNPEAVPGLLGPLIGHFIFSGLAGLGGAGIVRALARFSRVSVFSGSWDHFVFRCVPHHWVIVGLRNGESYTGALEAADTSVGPAERDLVLQEPAKYESAKGRYEVTGYQYLFIPGEFVASIGVVHEPSLDERIGPTEGTLPQAEDQ